MQFTFHQVSKPVAFLTDMSVVSLDANSNTRGGLRFFTFLPVDVANWWIGPAKLLSDLNFWGPPSNLEQEKLHRPWLKANPEPPVVCSREPGSHSLTFSLTVPHLTSSYSNCSTCFSPPHFSNTFYPPWADKKTGWTYRTVWKMDEHSQHVGRENRHWSCNPADGCSPHPPASSRIRVVNLFTLCRREPLALFNKAHKHKPAEWGLYCRRAEL